MQFSKIILHRNAPDLIVFEPERSQIWCISMKIVCVSFYIINQYSGKIIFDVFTLWTSNSFYKFQVVPEKLQCSKIIYHRNAPDMIVFQPERSQIWCILMNIVHENAPDLAPFWLKKSKSGAFCLPCHQFYTVHSYLHLKKVKY